MKLSSLAQSVSKQNGGVECDFDGLKLKIARLGNDAYNAEVAKENANNRERKERGEPAREFLDFWPELVAKTVLLDILNGEHDDGAPIVYTPEFGLSLLRDPRFSDLLKFIETAAATRANFKESADAKAEKN